MTTTITYQDQKFMLNKDFTWLNEDFIIVPSYLQITLTQELKRLNNKPKAKRVKKTWIITSVFGRYGKDLTFTSKAKANAWIREHVTINQREHEEFKAVELGN